MTGVGPPDLAGPDLPLVLVVDDDEDVRGLVVRTLEAAGMHTTEAADGRQAIELAEAEHPDVVVTDLMMPGIDGFELTLRLRSHPDSRLAKVPILILTQRAQPEYRDRVTYLGASGYLTKPVDPDEVRSTVFALLERA